MKIGLLIRRWRTMTEMNSRDMAEEIGIGLSTLNRIERGLPMDGVALAKILAWLLADAKGKETK